MIILRLHEQTTESFELLNTELTETNLGYHARIILYPTSNIPMNHYWNSVVINSEEHLQQAKEVMHTMVEHQRSVILDGVSAHLADTYLDLRSSGLIFYVHKEYSPIIDLSDLSPTDILTVQGTLETDVSLFTKFDSMIDITLQGTVMFRNGIRIGDLATGSTLMESILYTDEDLVRTAKEFRKLYTDPYINANVASFEEATFLTLETAAALIERKRHLFLRVTDLSRDDQDLLDSALLRILGKTGTYLSVTDYYNSCQEAKNVPIL